MPPKPLPGPMIDLATDGLPRVHNRGEVIAACRRIMLSAARLGWTWADVHAVFTDTHRYRLARQLATGREDRPLPRTKVNETLTDLWDKTTAFAEKNPAWEPRDVERFLATVRDSLDAADVAPLHRAVLSVVLDLAAEHGTTRPAAPARVVAERVGIGKNRAHATLMQLCEAGDWLALAKRGNKTRANLYTLAPALRTEEPAPLATSTAPSLTGTQAMPPENTLTLTLDDETRRAVLALLAGRERTEGTAQPEPNTAAQGNVIPLARARARRK